MLKDMLLIWRFRSGDSSALAKIYEDHRRNLLRIAAGLLDQASDGREVQSTIFFHDGDSGFEIPDAGTEPGGVVLIRVKGIPLSEEAESEGPLEFLFRIQVDLS